MPILNRLTKTDGSWEQFESDWSQQCATYDESLDGFSPAHFPMLELAATDDRRCGAFALKDSSGKHIAACQLNITPLPGYVGPVIRLRFLTVCPEFDFGVLSQEGYSALLGKFLIGVLQLSEENDWTSNHIKFHLPSPGDQTFFGALTGPLMATGNFDKVCVQGSWLYISKRRSE